MDSAQAIAGQQIYEVVDLAILYSLYNVHALYRQYRIERS